MPNRIWKFRFPDGHVELRTFPDPLTEGEELTMRGARWVVGPIGDHTITLIPKSAEDADGSETAALPSDPLTGYVDQ